MQEHGRTRAYHTSKPQIPGSMSKVLCISLEHFGNFQGTGANPPAGPMSADICFFNRAPVKPGAEGQQPGGLRPGWSLE